MLHKYTFYILSLLLNAATVTLSAQDYVVSRRICSADGLSNDFVMKMAFDGDGYIWTTSEAGVNRISGGSCQTFLVTEWPLTSNSMQLADYTRPLLGQRTSTVFGMRTTALRWHEPTKKMLIGTEFGLIIYDIRHATVRYLTAQDGLINEGLEDIVESPDGVWLVYAGGNVQHLDCNTLKVTRLKHGATYHTNCSETDMNGHLYIGHTKNGMSIVDIKTGVTRHYEHSDSDPGSLPGNNVRRIYRDTYNRIWVGTDGGLALFHPTTGRFTHVTGNNENLKDNVYDIRQMNNGTLWIATDIGGIRILNPDQDVNDGRLHYNHSYVMTSSPNTRAVIQDEYGNVWIGNHSTGVDFISERKPDFRVFGNNETSRSSMLTSAYSITKSRTGDALWIMFGSELTLWKDGKILNHWDIRDDQRAGQIYARSLLAASDGSIWIGIDDRGVMRFDSNSGKIQYINLPGAGPTDIHSISEDAQGRIWIGSEVGVYCYTKEKGAVKADLVNKITRNSLITCFIWLNDHTLFVTTYGRGVYTINMKTGKSAKLQLDGGLPSLRVNQAITDGKGGLWLATHLGLAHVDNAMTLKGVKVYGAMQGLSDSYICSLTSDSSGRIWMSNHSAISCLDCKNERIHNYNHLDMGQACGFYAGAIVNWNNDIFMCSTAGVVQFNPVQLSASKQVSQAQIVSCEVYSPEGSNTKIIMLSPDDNGTLRTDYKQNTLRLNFCVRNYAQTDHVEYSYMMKGMDDKWYYIDNDKDVVFRGLPPGNYTFILRAKLKGQDWSEASTCEAKIRITPPLWQTWWAYIIYTIVLGLLIFTAIRQYKYRLKLRGKLELEKRESIQKQKANEERLHFFTNITHELRTPLTLILGPLEDLMDDGSMSQPSKRRVSMIHKNTERLRNLINEILEFRKTETQNRRLSVAKGDIGAFVNEICLNYKGLYNNPKVRFSYSIEPGLPPMYFDSEVITTILNNFLSNAIKYTEQGEITVTLDTTGPTVNGIQPHEGDKPAGMMVYLTVADTGYGISQDALPHVFERYYQAEGEHQASGTGIGLALVKALADLHEAQLGVVSKEGSGSVFTLALDIANTYPDALHKEDVEQPQKPNIDSDVTSNDSEEEEEGNQAPTLLIVEDNADIREYIADSFCDDFHILLAANGAEGLQQALENIPDIIVSDIMMPKMNGIQMTKMVKEDIRTSHIPVILLTAKDTDDDKEEGYDSGADSYLTKPFTAKLLGSRIHNLLNARRRLAEHLNLSMGIHTAANDDSHPAGQDSNGDASAPQGSQGGATAVKGAGAAGAKPQSGGSDNGKAGTEEVFLTALDRQFLERLDKVIRDNVMSDDLDLPFVSNQMAMSHSTFYRKVKGLTGMTAKEYIRKFRLRHCYHLLESGEYNVNEAAMLTGFNQMAHFRQTFKNEFGILPSEVKRKK